jgi:hypothetical protein
MNHKILTNQIMLSPTEGYLSPCPSLPLSLGSLCSFPLLPGNKESLGQITPLHMVILGPYNIGIGNGVLNRTPIAQEIRITDKWDCIKLKSCAWQRKQLPE